MLCTAIAGTKLFQLLGRIILCHTDAFLEAVFGIAKYRARCPGATEVVLFSR